jgi:uncharacterized protein YbaR (Trm112 family)
MTPALLEILCCPETHQPLHEAAPALIEQLNTAIRAGSVQNRAGKKVEEPLEAGLARQDGACLYPVRRGIPLMLIDEAIPLVPARQAS